MNKVLTRAFYFLIVGIVLCSNSYAAKDAGVCVYGAETVDNVVCYGPTVMKQTIVTGDIKVVGTLRAENISARNIHIDGAAELKNSVIIQSTKVVGSLQASNVEFKQGIAINSNSIKLHGSTVNGMVTVTSPDKTPYLQLECSSVVTGAVLFDGKAGVIQITGDSLVQGNVSNGARERVVRSCNE